VIDCFEQSNELLGSVKYMDFSVIFSRRHCSMELGTFPVADMNMEVTFGHSSPRYLCTSFDTT
jgi:hypothetical protein